MEIILHGAPFIWLQQGFELLWSKGFWCLRSPGAGTKAWKERLKKDSSPGYLEHDIHYPGESR